MSSREIASATSEQISNFLQHIVHEVEFPIRPAKLESAIVKTAKFPKDVFEC